MEFSCIVKLRTHFYVKLNSEKFCTCFFYKDMTKRKKGDNSNLTHRNILFRINLFLYSKIDIGILFSKRECKVDN